MHALRTSAARARGFSPAALDARNSQILRGATGTARFSLFAAWHGCCFPFAMSGGTKLRRRFV
jgi:hypothetical protein